MADRVVKVAVQWCHGLLWMAEPPAGGFQGCGSAWPLHVVTTQLTPVTVGRSVLTEKGLTHRKKHVEGTEVAHEPVTESL